MINKIPNPNTKKFIISYVGDFLGDIIRTYNLDLFSRGLAKVGKKIYPHTSLTGNVYDFTSARLDNGATGPTGPTGLTQKIWAVSEGKNILHSYNKEFFEVGPIGGFSSDEDTGFGSDMFAVGDETGEDLEVTPVSIDGTTREFEVGVFDTAERLSQSITNVSGPLNKVIVEVKKAGTNADLTVTVEEDNSGVPSGVALTTAVFPKEDITDDYALLEIENFDTQINLDREKKYWINFKGNDNKFKYIIGADDEDDIYEDGELFVGKVGAIWKFVTTFLSTTNTVYPNGGDGEMWGTTWTPAEVNHANFGIWVGGNTSTAPTATEYGIDHIRARIHYTDEGVASVTAFRSPTANNSVELGGLPVDPWTNPSNAYTENGSYATSSMGDEKISCWKTFGFTVPVEATVTGIEVEIKGLLVVNGLSTNYPHLSGWLTKDSANIVGSGKSFGLKPPTDLKMDLGMKYPAAPERLYLSTTKDIRFLNKENGIWESLWKGILQQDEFNEDYPVIVKNLGAGGTLMIGNENKIHSTIATAVNPSEVELNRLIFDASYYINWMGVTSNAVFIGLAHKNSEILPAQVVHYEPGAERTRIYTIKEGATMGFVMNENCYIIDKKGQLRGYTGQSFQTINYFPPFYREEFIETLPHRNGITVRGDIAKIAWKGQYPDPSGIWVFENGNIYHKQSLVFDATTLNSLGAIEVEDLGAVYEEDELYVGGSVLDGSEAEIKGIYSTIKTAVSDENRASIITSKMISPEIDNVWQDLAIKYRNGTFIVKQKVEADGTTEGAGAYSFSGTWTAAKTFTSTDANFIAEVNNGNIKVGDEVIIRKGTGAGLTAHIESITGTSTKTVVIDDGLAVTTGKFKFSCERWKKINLSYKTDKLSAQASLKDKRLENAQFKIDTRGTLEEIQIQSIVDKTLKK